jgi:hypothetical protein
LTPSQQLSVKSAIAISNLVFASLFAIWAHARGKEQVGPDTTSARAGGKASAVSASAWSTSLSAEVGIKASEAGLLLVHGVLVLSQERIADEHTEALW